MLTQVKQPKIDYADTLKPTGVKAETISRGVVDNTALAALVSQRLSFFAIALRKGTVINNISFMSGGTALAMTNQWFSLYSRTLDLLRTTVDDGAAEWVASTVKTLALTSPYTIPEDDLYYLGILINATTVPTLSGILGAEVLMGLAPVLAGTSNTGITTPDTAPAKAAALTAYASRAYASVS